MIYKNRKMFENLSVRAGTLFSKLQLSANQWTMLSLMLIAVTFYFLVTGDFLVSAILLAFTSFIDVIDGAVARATKKTTIFGAYLDTMSDRVIEFVTILGLFMIGYPDFILPINVWLATLLFSCVMITYAKAAASEKGLVKNELKGGILEHPDRMLFFIAIVLVSIYSLEYASFLIAVMTILTITTAAQRFLIAIRGKI
jgi:archaetidylinositol phosphate synthase